MNCPECYSINVSSRLASISYLSSDGKKKEKCYRHKCLSCGHSYDDIDKTFLHDSGKITLELLGKLSSGRLSQADLARRLNVSPSYISRYLKNDCMIGSSKKNKLFCCHCGSGNVKEKKRYERMVLGMDKKKVLVPIVDCMDCENRSVCGSVMTDCLFHEFDAGEYVCDSEYYYNKVKEAYENEKGFRAYRHNFRRKNVRNS